jgi:chitodextrinase
MKKSLIRYISLIMLLAISAVYTGVAYPSPQDIPAAPTNLAASLTNPRTAHLTWTDNSNNEQGFRIEAKRGTDTSFRPVAQIPMNATMFDARELMPGTTYTFRVRAFNQSGNSAPSNTQSVTTPADTVTRPAAPSNLAAQVLSSRSVKLTWTDNSNNEAGFRVEVKRASDTMYQHCRIEVHQNITTVTLMDLRPNTTYNFRVRAVNRAGMSDPSNVATATTPNDTNFVPPAAPSGLTALAVAPGTIRLHWTDNAANEEGFRIQGKKSSDTAYRPMGETRRDSVNFLVRMLAPNTIYIFRVSAFNHAGNSAWSNTASDTTFAGPNYPGEGALEFKLYGNYPNPFNPTTSISFQIPSAELVKLKIYDMVGREVAVLVNENMEPGVYNVVFNAASLSSGSYFYRLEAGSNVEIKRMMLIK